MRRLPSDALFVSRRLPAEMRALCPSAAPVWKLQRLRSEVCSMHLPAAVLRLLRYLLSQVLSPHMLAVQVA